MAVEEIKSITIVEKQNSVNEQNKTYPKTEPYPNDSVEISGKETKKKNSVVKTLLGIGAGIVAAGTTLSVAVILMARNHGKKIAKLYNEKLIISNLPEKLEFTPAKTIEEGVKFAKEVLGIKEVDKNFTLEAINTANKGLVDVSNANKGKLFVPTRLGFETPKDKNDDFLAYVIKDIYSEKFGNLVINKDYFDAKVLDKEIKSHLFYDTGEPLYNISDDLKKITSSWRVGSVRPFPNDDIAELIKKFYKEPSSLNVTEKQQLFYSLEYAYTSAMRTFRNPIDALKKILESKSEFLEQNGLQFNIAEIESLDTKKQVEFLRDLVNKMEAKGSYWRERFGIEYPTSTIYHEMGHLQDFAKNLKELDIKSWRFNLREIWQEAGHQVKTGEDISRIGVKEVDNRWASIWKEKYEKLLKDDSEKFKKYYPDMYEFVTNQQIQQTAGKISSYAQSGIGEFIAEVYSRLVAGKPVPEDVMTLYRKYKGPELAI